MNERMERMNVWTYECESDGMNMKWMTEWMKEMNELNEWMNEWIYQWTNE
jgi:hypothetical protein